MEYILILLAFVALIAAHPGTVYRTPPYPGVVIDDSDDGEDPSAPN